MNSLTQTVCLTLYKRFTENTFLFMAKSCGSSLKGREREHTHLVATQHNGSIVLGTARQLAKTAR